MINIIYCSNAHVPAALDFAAPAASFSATAARVEPMEMPCLILVLVECHSFFCFKETFS